MFSTLFERKLLRRGQTRKGPEKVWHRGRIQPLRDGAKLLLKSPLSVSFIRRGVFFGAPLGVLILLLATRQILHRVREERRNWGRVYLFCCLGLGVYFVYLKGWGRGRKYRWLGGGRASLQAISYEVTLILLLIIWLLPLKNYYFSFSSLALLGARVPLLGMILAERNRAPLDLLEGERELVSGFNTEFRRGPFALIFVAEYGFVLFFGGLLSQLFSLPFWRRILLLLRVRACYPRARFDSLLHLCWWKVLPFRLGGGILVYVV